MITTTEARLLSLRTVGWVAVAAMLALALLGGTSPRSVLAATEHCPDGGTKVEASGDDKNDVVLADGTVFCVKAGTEASGEQTADGTKKLIDYVTWKNDGGQTPDVSYYVIYSTPTPTPTPEETPTPTPTPEETPTPTPTPEETPTPTPTPEPTPTPTPEATPTPTPEPTPTPTPTPDGGVEGETATPVLTLPPSDAFSGTSAPGADATRTALVVLAGILAAVLVLTPSRASRRR